MELELKLTTVELELATLASRFTEARPAIERLQSDLREFSANTSAKQISMQLASRHSSGRGTSINRNEQQGNKHTL